MSPSQQQSETARINGAQSHGPVTAEGKAVSAMNSLKHGLCSKQIVLPGEDPEAFARLRADYVKRFRPQGDAEQELVETIAAATWRLKRVIFLETALLNDDNTDPMKALSLLIRYENSLNRTYDQSLKRLKELQENSPVAQASACERNEPKPVSDLRESASILGQKITLKPAQSLDRSQNLALRL